MTTPRALPRELWSLASRSATGEDWPPRSSATAERLVEFAYRHRLLPLLFAEPPIDGPLRSALERSRALSSAQRFRTRKLIETLQTLFAAVGEEPFALIKGCDFAFRLYPEPDLRPMADVDVLVPRERARAVRDLLEAEGLTPYYPIPVSHLPTHHEFAFHGAGVTIEVHHSFIQRTRHRIDYDEIWARREPLRTPAGNASRLADRDALLGLCVAVAADHFETPLIRFVDLHLLVGDDPRIVEAAAGIARSWECERAVYGTLRRYCRLFPESCPPLVEQTVRSLLTARSRSFIDRRVLPRKLPDDEFRRRRRRELWRKFWMMDSYRRRIGFFSYHVAGSAVGILAGLLARWSPGSTRRGTEDAG